MVFFYIPKDCLYAPRIASERSAFPTAVDFGGIVKNRGTGVLSAVYVEEDP